MGNGKPRVLIVEDEPDMNNLVAEVLRAYGFEPVQAATGEEALRVVAQAPPDAVILDLMLPGLSGYELCRRLKGARETHAIPVLMLTALDRNVDRRHGYESGADYYMTKPFSPEGLVSRLQGCLDRCREAAQATAPLSLATELTAAVGSLRGINALATALYCRTALAPEAIETLRSGLIRIAGLAEKWALGHGGVAPVRLAIDLDDRRVRLAFTPAAEGAGQFLAAHLTPDAAIPAGFTDAGIVDRIYSENTGLVLEKSLVPPAGA